MKKLLSVGLVLVFLASALSGCTMFTPKTTQFTHGLVDLVMQPIRMGDPGSQEYTKDLAGDFNKMMAERSSEAELTLSVADYGGLEDLGVDQYLDGAQLTFNTAYDTKSGDGQLDFNGLGLVNGSLAIREGSLAVDVSQFLGNLIIYEFESGLDFKKDVTFNDRMDDIAKALNPEAMGTTETIDQAEKLLYKYADIAAKQIDTNSIESGKETISIMNKDVKVDTQTFELTADDLQNITQAVLETALEDDELVEFIYTNYPESAMYYEDMDEFKDEYQTSIEDALDNLDDSFEDTEVDITLSIYFTSPKLPFQAKKAVAVQIDFADEWSEYTAFYKFIKDGREFDFELNYDDGYAPFEYYASNIKDGNQYVLDGELVMPDDSYYLVISGTTDVSNTKEIGEYEINFSSYDIENITLVITNELTQVKKGSEYEMTGTLDVDTVINGMPIYLALDLEGEYTFADSVSVDLVDFDDPDAQVYDNFEDLIYDFGGYLPY